MKKEAEILLRSTGGSEKIFKKSEVMMNSVVEDYTKRKIKAWLMSKRKGCQQQLRELHSIVKERLREPTLRPKDHIADSTASLDANLSSRIYTLEKLTTKANEALERVDQGTYGICEDCGESIPLARLQVVPFTNRCVSCKAKAESDDTIIVNGTPRRISHLTRKTITLP